MPEQQLREAFALMKQGEKKQAMMIVRAVIGENRQNIDAWWLMSNLLEDEDKILKCLNQILELEPNHRGARKKLISLRPDLIDNLAPTDDEIKKKKDEYDWSRLNHQDEPRNASFKIPMGIGAIILLLLMIFVAGLGVYDTVETKISLPDEYGNTPQEVTMEFLKALRKQDTDLLYELTCPDYYYQIEEYMEDFIDVDLSGWIVVTTNTTIELYHYSGNQAYVTIHGSMWVDGYGQNYSIDWDEAATSTGYDFYGQHLYRTDDVWQVCKERRVPNLVWRGD